MAAGFELVSRLRKNPALRYYYSGPQTGRGRPKKYAGAVQLDALDAQVFTRESTLCTDRREVSSGVVELRASACKIRLVIVQERKANGELGARWLMMSTNPERTAAEIIEAYPARFQQEFLFRDAKQFAGLEDGQGRTWQKIDCHTNAALTTVNLAKCAHYLNLTPEERPAAFSMASITQGYANQRLTLRIFSRCGIDPQLE